MRYKAHFLFLILPMKRFIILFSFLIASCLIQGQSKTDKVKKDSLEGWSTDGKFTILINQSAFSNWQAGGDNNLAANASVNYAIDYKKGPWLLDNKIIASYGITLQSDDGLQRTDDRIDINSVMGRNLKKKNWSISFFMNFRTQFTDGYNYDDDFNGDNEDFPTSGFFKPAYLSFGPGFLWKRDKNLTANIAPITSKFTFLTSVVYTINDDDSDNVYYQSSDEIETYGVPPGERLLYEFGIHLRGYYKFDIMKNISMENTLDLYSNYLDEPLNIDINYTMNIVMKINDVFSTNFTFQTIYDDHAFPGFQIREVFGLGVNVDL
jgi:hypothetical protein